MARTILPNLTDALFYDFEIDLEGTTYTFEFRRNDRAAAWYMTILDASGTVLLASRKVTLNFPLLARFRDFRLPKGDLMAIDTANGDEMPGATDLGDRVIVVYTPSDELPA